MADRGVAAQQTGLHIDAKQGLQPSNALGRRPASAWPTRRVGGGVTADAQFARSSQNFQMSLSRPDRIPKENVSLVQIAAIF